jgi:hemerythrin-like metal-binding protein
VSLKTPFEPIEWVESMATGVAAVDKQHRFLVDTLQQANQELMDDHDAELLMTISKDLLGYALTHFDTEETLMQRYGYQEAYPEKAREHIAQHREFSRQVVAFCDRMREGRGVSRMELLKFLNHWLRDHVLGIDQLLGDFLREAMRDVDSEADH